MDEILPPDLVTQPMEQTHDVLPANNKKHSRPIALIVEDSIDVIYYLKTCLQNQYALRIAHSGQEGIDKALEITPDIIISDVMMPEKNGYELTDTLKNNVKTSHVPIILLTAKATEKDKLEGLGVGADAYLTKPFNVDELKIRIKNLINERKKLWQYYSESFSYKPENLKISSPDQKFLTRALEILEENKSDSTFNSSKLQKELGISKTLLHVKLKALTGKSTTEFIRTYRLKYSATLILQDCGNISEIAYESGFNDQGYFGKSFRKHFGVTPTEYKQQNSI
jgi:DNA-binding response OmpR family regulator